MRVNLIFNVFWQFKEFTHLKVTKCKKIINTKSGKILNYTVRGCFIGGKYYKKNQLNKLTEKIPEDDYLPF